MLDATADLIVIGTNACRSVFESHPAFRLADTRRLRFTVFAPHEIADVCLHLIFTGVDVNYLSSRVVEISHHRGINFVDI